MTDKVRRFNCRLKEKQNLSHSPRVRNINPYNSMIRVGRLLKHNRISAEKDAAQLQDYFTALESEMAGKSTEEFFTLFPPIKFYDDDGSWDYQSSLNFKEKLGPVFTADSFKELLMTRCYENPYIPQLGLAFMMSASTIYRQRTGRSMMEDTLIALNREKETASKRSHLYLVK